MDNSIIIGGITGFVSQGLTWPMEYLKTTKQLPLTFPLLIPL